MKCFVILCVCILTGEVHCWTKREKKQLSNFAHCLCYFHHAGSHFVGLFTAECTIMTLFVASTFKANAFFHLLIFSTKYLLMPVDSKSDHKSTYLFCRFLWITELFAVWAYFSLTVSIVLIMHGAWVHRSAAVDSPQMNLFLHLVVDVQERVFGSQLHQSPNPPAPTCTSPLMNSPAAHYWRHFMVV